MGKSVIFIGDTTFNLGTIKTMRFNGKVEVRDYGEKQLDILFKENYEAYVSFQFDYDGMIAHDYSPEELKNLPYKNPQFILVVYSNLNLLKQIISATDFPKDIIIDCDGINLGLEKLVGKNRLFNAPTFGTKCSKAGGDGLFLHH